MSLDAEADLDELLSSGNVPPSVVSGNRRRDSQPQPPDVALAPSMDLRQWQVGPNGVFRPASRTVKALPAGAYSVTRDDGGLLVTAQILMSDEIIELPDSANTRVLAGIQKFWSVRDRYTQRGLIFKRGVLLWGPPGSGKTVTIHLLARDLIRNGGIVLFCGHPSLMAHALSVIRRIESKRPLIVVIEDVDETIATFGESGLLAMLDGENQIDNVCYVATTNYPDRLGARIINRPSRFDERVYVGMPEEAARLAYLQRACGDSLDAQAIAMWVEKTNNLSVAHLRELVAAVLCLEQPFDTALRRLRSMTERPKEVDGFGRKALGFGGKDG